MTALLGSILIDVASGDLDGDARSLAELAGDGHDAAMGPD